MEKITPTQAIEILFSKKPNFHGREDAGSKNYAIKPNVLKWITNNIHSGANTLETGCGYSILY